MKKISFILLAIAFIFASCEKESKFVDVQIIDIHESTITYRVTNNSDFDIQANVYLKIDGEKQIGWESPCCTFRAGSIVERIYEATGLVYGVDAKVNLCEI